MHGRIPISTLHPIIRMKPDEHGADALDPDEAVAEPGEAGDGEERDWIEFDAEIDA